jgi:hypothetical protein
LSRALSVRYGHATLARGRPKLRVVGLATRSLHHPCLRASRVRHARRMVRWPRRGTVAVAVTGEDRRERQRLPVRSRPRRHRQARGQPGRTLPVRCLSPGPDRGVADVVTVTDIAGGTPVFEIPINDVAGLAIRASIMCFCAPRRQTASPSTTVSIRLSRQRSRVPAGKRCRRNPSPNMNTAE